MNAKGLKSKFLDALVAQNVPGLQIENNFDVKGFQFIAPSVEDARLFSRDIGRIYSEKKEKSPSHTLPSIGNIIRVYSSPFKFESTKEQAEGGLESVKKELLSKTENTGLQFGETKTISSFGGKRFSATCRSNKVGWGCAGSRNRDIKIANYIEILDTYFERDPSGLMKKMGLKYDIEPAAQQLVAMVEQPSGTWASCYEPNKGSGLETSRLINPVNKGGTFKR